MKLFQLLRKEEFLKKFKTVAFACFIISFFILLSSFVDWVPGSSKYFAYNTKSGLFFRIIASFLFLAPALIGMLIYWQQIDKRWLILFAFIIFFSLVSTLYTPWSYSVLYRTERLGDNFMASLTISLSLNEIIVGCLSFVVDVLFGYVLLFIYPKILSLKKLYIIFAVFSLIILYSCFYSFIKERDYYIKFLSGNWSYTNKTIGSIFGHKQQWGVFLISSVVVCALSIFLTFKLFVKKSFRFCLASFFTIVLILSFACSVFAFCKTAIIANFSFLLVVLICSLVALIRNQKTRKIGIILSALFVVTISSTAIFFTIPGTKIYNVFQNILTAFDKHSDESIGIRYTLAIGFLKNIPSYSIPFGMPKPLVDPFVRTLMPEIVNGLHTGYIIFFARTGLFGILVFTALLFIVFKEIKKIGIENKMLLSLLIASFISSIIISLSESEILIFSSSMISFMPNLILISFPFIYPKKEVTTHEAFVSVYI